METSLEAIASVLILIAISLISGWFLLYRREPPDRSHCLVLKRMLDYRNKNTLYFLIKNRILDAAQYSYSIAYDDFVTVHPRVFIPFSTRHVQQEGDVLTIRRLVARGRFGEFIFLGSSRNFETTSLRLSDMKNEKYINEIQAQFNDREPLIGRNGFLWPLFGLKLGSRVLTVHNEDLCSNLEKAIGQRQVFTPYLVLTIYQQVLSALRYLDRKNLNVLKLTPASIWNKNGFGTGATLDVQFIFLGSSRNFETTSLRLSDMKNEKYINEIQAQFNDREPLIGRNGFLWPLFGLKLGSRVLTVHNEDLCSNLEKAIGQRQVFTPYLVLTIYQQVLSALRYLDRKNLNVLKLTPASIRNKNGFGTGATLDVQLSDLFWCRKSEENGQTSSEGLRFDNPYSAPGFGYISYDPTFSFFSLGAILMDLLSSTPLFYNANVEDMDTVWKKMYGAEAQVLAYLRVNPNDLASYTREYADRLDRSFLGNKVWEKIASSLLPRYDDRCNALDQNGIYTGP